MLVIDAANVIGSRPTGWWRDRPGAAQRFTEQVRATVTVGALEPPVTVVLEGQFRRGAAEADIDGVVVVHAPGEGDDTIAAVAAAHDEPTSSPPTADWPSVCERPAARSSARTGSSTGWWRSPDLRTARSRQR